MIRLGFPVHIVIPDDEEDLSLSRLAMAANDLQSSRERRWSTSAQFDDLSRLLDELNDYKQSLQSAMAEHLSKIGR